MSSFPLLALCSSVCNWLDFKHRLSYLQLGYLTVTKTRVGCKKLRDKRYSLLARSQRKKFPNRDQNNLSNSKLLSDFAEKRFTMCYGLAKLPRRTQVSSLWLSVYGYAA